MQGIEVVDAGAADGRVQFGVAHVGDSARATTSLEIDLAVDLPGESERATSFAITLEGENTVSEVAEDGGRTVHETVRSVTVDRAPDGAELAELEAQYAALADVTFEQVYDANGVPVRTSVLDEASLDPAAREIAREIQESASTATVYFPTEPLGLGATWTATQVTAKQGFELMVTYHYELTALDGDRYEITIGYDDDIDQELTSEGATFDANGSIRGSGTATGSVANPLVQSARADQTLEMELEADGETATVRAGYHVDVMATA